MKTPSFLVLARGLLLFSIIAHSSIQPASADQSPLLNENTSLKPSAGFEQFTIPPKDRSFNADILYLQTMLSYAPVADPRPVFLLVNAYLVAKQQDIGIDYFEKLFEKFDGKMDPVTHANYLAAYAILRATYADDVFLLSRIGWVWDTFDILVKAKEIGGQDNPLIRWAAGLIYAQVPWFFGKEDAALTDLLWLDTHPETEPEPGFYREAYAHLSDIYKNKGEASLAEHYLKKSGYEDYNPTALFMGWFSASKGKGLLFSPKPWISEIIPDRLFAVRGFGFSEIHFVLSEDGKELVSIDAGTQPFSMQAAYEFLMKNHPDLPPITAALITHAHWDHIGGHSYLKSLNPDIKIYGRENYHGTLDRVQRNHAYTQFRSEHYQDAWVKDYKPDIAVSERREVIIGGTRFDLVPAIGGETEDAMLIHIPDLKTSFMGDALMPFYGEPWVEEGFIDGALLTMDEVLKKQPEIILHGHYALNYLYSSEKLAGYRKAYAWLVDQTRIHIKDGYSVKEIIRMNLIPPFMNDHLEGIVSYMGPRNHIIARVGDRMTGIWQEESTGQEPAGLDVITSAEYARLLGKYLDLSAGETATAIQNMLDNGDNELALQMATAAQIQYAGNSEIILLREQAADRLRAAVQFLDPFKFVVYTEMIDKEHLPISTE